VFARHEQSISQLACGKEATEKRLLWDYAQQLIYLLYCNYHIQQMLFLLVLFLLRI